MEIEYMSKKEVLQLAREIAQQRGISMSRVHNLLIEQNHLLDAVESASIINAEQGMGAVSFGLDPYGIDWVSTNKEQRRLAEIQTILNPRKESFDSFEGEEEALPF